MTSIQHMRKRKSEILELFRKNEIVVSLLSHNSSLCDEIGKSFQLEKELGKGVDGKVWQIDNQGEYIAVKIPYLPLEIVEGKVEKEETLEEYAESNEKLSKINKFAIININGGDPNKIIRSGDVILLPKFAKNCLTTKSEQFNYISSHQKILVVPKKSYLCDNESFSEYLLGILLSELYTKGMRGIMSINFVDMLDFASCPDGKNPFLNRRFKVGKYNDKNNLSYIFQQKLEGEIFGRDSPFHREDISFVILQILHAIECYQRSYQISHNDLHVRNIMYAKIPDEWNGQDIQSADYFEYVIDDTSFYIPASDYVIKIIDFGTSAKYSIPMVGTPYIFESSDGYFPNFYSPAYDVGTILMSILNFTGDDFDGNHFISLCLHYFIGEFRSEEFQKLLQDSDNDLLNSKIVEWLYSRQSEYSDNPIFPEFFDQEEHRPLIDKLEEFPLNIMDAATILKSNIFKDHRIRPGGKIVRVGFC